MNRTDHRIIFTALGFLAVILNDVPENKRGLRAEAIANLMESFCLTSVPEAFSYVEKHQKKKALEDAKEALESIINDGLTFSTEQLAERAVANINQAIQ